MDFLSSVVVLWRFYAPSTVDDTLERLLKHREERASLAISIIMIVLGFFVMLAAFADLLRGADTIEQKAAIFTLSFLTIFYFGALTYLKFKYARLLESPSLRKDGICSLIGTALGISLFIDTLIEVKNDNLWWLDPVVAFIAGAIAAYLGAQALQKAQSAGVPVFDKSWWYSGGDDVTATTSNGGVEMSTANGATESDGEIPVEPLDEDQKEVV